MMDYFTMFVFGLLIGSFMNVIIYRLPLGYSVVYPASRCPHCQHRLAWFELIPLLSYMLQLGKCRHCRVPISFRYPMVEFLTALIYLLCYIHYGLSSMLLVALVFVSVLLPIVFIDLQHQIIPDILNITGATFAFLILPLSDVSLLNSLTGALLGGAIMLIIAIISRGGMGGGDVKMVAMMGLFLGWKLTLLALFLSFVIGGLGSLLLILFRIKKRKDFIPFGPFLAIGGFTAYVFGTEILTWYFKAFIG